MLAVSQAVEMEILCKWNGKFLFQSVGTERVEYLRRLSICSGKFPLELCVPFVPGPFHTGISSLNWPFTIAFINLKVNLPDWYWGQGKKLIIILFWMPSCIWQHDSRIVQQFKRLESLAEGRIRSYTDAADCSLIKRGKSDHRLTSFVKQQPSLRRGNHNILHFKPLFPLSKKCWWQFSKVSSENFQMKITTWKH